MESISGTPILEFNSNTLVDVRKHFNLEKATTINESIDILDKWIQQQGHHVKKDYPRGHLERAIIFNKGSVERTKTKIDNICKLRRIYPQYFGTLTREERLVYPDVVDGVLPKMTPDHERVYILRNAGKKFETGFFQYYRYLLGIAHYAQAHDYNTGVIIVCDYLDVDVFELFKMLNVVEMQQTLNIITDGFGMRLKGVHLLSKNKAIDLIAKVFNQVLSAKLAGRVMVHKTIDTLHEYIPRDILPVEYGGTEKSLEDIYENNLNEITSDAFNKYLNEMSTAVTSEEYRLSDGTNTDYTGVPGTFRTIAID